MLAPLSMIFVWIWLPFFGDVAYIFYMSLMVAFVTLFLAWDTKVLMGGGRLQLSPDDYIIAVIQLYYDIVLIFKYLLLIFGRAD